jgi:hypothetical protein
MGRVPETERIIDGSALWGDDPAERSEVPEKEAENVENRDESRGRGGAAVLVGRLLSPFRGAKSDALLEPLSGRSRRMGERSSSCVHNQQKQRCKQATPVKLSPSWSRTLE